MMTASAPGEDFSYADSLLAAGDIDRSLRALEAIAAGRLEWPAALAWRVGLVHYLLRGSPRDALERLERGELGNENTADEAQLLGWLASAHWALGHVEQCTDYAGRAFLAAQAADDDRAKAAAHAALALKAMLAGDRAENATHYAKAMRYAAISGDRIQLIRVKMNRASHYLDEGNYQAALGDLHEAIILAEEIGNPVLLAMALINESEALNSLGRFGEAVEHLGRAIQLCQQAGSSKVCFGLLTLGEVQLRRGQRALARSAFEEVIPLAEDHGHLQVVVSALAGLAEVTCDDDVVAAMELAERARQHAVGPFATVALLALARVTLAAGDAGKAAELGEEAQRSARAHRDRASIAKALELQAEICGDWERSGRYLTEARTIWVDLGATFDAGRVTLALGRSAAVSTAPIAEGAVVIRALGRFEVIVDGKPLLPSAWQSRKARDLLRLLVARRGRPSTRDELIELLWAEECAAKPDRVAHRLAVALSIVRGVVDGSRVPASESAVIAEGSSIALDVDRMNIDLETFMRQADQGLRLSRGDRRDEGLAILAAAEQRYTGDFLEDEPYEPWTTVPREEARATYLRVSRTLADAALRRGDPDEAIHYLLRILAVDGYDEQSHIDIIDSYTLIGRHGEVKRAKDRYATAMTEIGVGVRK